MLCVARVKTVLNVRTLGGFLCEGSSGGRAIFVIDNYYLIFFLMKFCVLKILRQGGNSPRALSPTLRYHYDVTVSSSVALC